MSEETPENIIPSSPSESIEQARFREIELFLVRHAEASDQSVEAPLTENGRKQAEERAISLLHQIITSGGGVIKFLSSPIPRAQETFDIMLQTVEKIILEENIQNVRIMDSHIRKSMQAGGVIGPLSKKGIDDPVEYWLQNPDVLEGKEPHTIAMRVQKLANILQKVSERLPEGEKIYYVVITHEVPQAAFLNSVSGKTLNGLGGKIENCESINVKFGGENSDGPTLAFRDLEVKLKSL